MKDAEKIVIFVLIGALTIALIYLLYDGNRMNGLDTNKNSDKSMKCMKYNDKNYGKCMKCMKCDGNTCMKYNQCMSSSTIRPQNDQMMAMIQPQNDQMMRMIQPQNDQMMRMIQPQNDQMMAMIQPQNDQMMRMNQPQNDQMMAMNQPQNDQMMAMIQPQNDQMMQKDNQRVIVMFFAPWCGHCKNMEPTWDEFMRNFDGYNGVKLMKINGQDNPQLMQLHSINAFPVVKYCPKGINNPDGVIYQGDRSMQSLAEFLQQYA